MKKKLVPIQKLSKKRATQNREYLKLRKIFLENNSTCFVKSEWCTFTAQHVHHKAGRVGKLLTDINNFLAVCDNCHRKIEMNPLWAKEKGYSKSRLSK